MKWSFREIGRAFPLTWLFVVWIGVPVLLALGAGYIHLRRSLPPSDTAFTLQAIDGQVTVTMDSRGVPTIEGRSDRDVFFGIGYLHAQNRMWQMEFHRRTGQGRLSEIFGKRTLAVDEYMRTLGLYRAAQSAYAHLPEPARQSLEAYARGVNAWIDGTPVLPPEFQLFRTKPEPWAPVDSILEIKLMALDLGANFRDELANQGLVSHLGEEKWRQLIATDELAAPILTRLEPATPFQPELLERVTGLHEQLAIGFNAAGSNAWVVAGSHTASGKPLLASDPHLAVSAPTAFYLARLRGARLHVRGATIPGLPIVVFGENGDLAWGATNVRADVQDLSIERLDPTNDQRYEVDGAWEALRTRTEWIHVAPAWPAFLHRPNQPVKWQVRATRNGPLISDVIGSSPYPMSLRWTALAEVDNSYSSFLAINYASTAAELNAALDDYVAPVLNFVYADSRGTIGSRVAGHIPVRSRGMGLLPQPGWSGTSAWERLLEPGELPCIENPASGYIVSANDPIPANGRLLSTNWQPPYRATRIRQLLDASIREHTRLRAEQFSRMQKDKLSLQAAELMPFLKSLRGRTQTQAELLDVLRGWDLKLEPSSTGAAIYVSWLAHFGLRLVEDELSPQAVEARLAPLLKAEASEVRPVFIRNVLRGAYPEWCDDVRTESVEDCADMALLALDDSYHELARLMGAAMRRWTLARLQKVVHVHSSLAEVPLLSRVFSRERGVGGGHYTIDVAGSRYSPGEGYVKRLGAVYRQVIDLGEAGSSRFVVDLGQSGNILSPHFDDGLEAFNRNPGQVGR